MPVGNFVCVAKKTKKRNQTEFVPKVKTDATGLSKMGVNELCDAI